MAEGSWLDQTIITHDCKLHGVTYIAHRGKIILGKYSAANSGTTFDARGANIIIGNNVGIGHNCFFVTSYGSHYLGQEAEKRKQDILVKDNAWIAYGAMIRGGVTIGRWATVGMGAVVLDDVPDFMVAVGNPAKIVGRRPDYKLILEAERTGKIPCVARKK